ncbi:DUF4177 domain-containing protein [Clostridium sp. B9]|uniref:DUF4177 domain-containing protein n=1 Tax=Clostridium sp. B9 TaxID=3423224 RepID=UPI003D2EBA81
MYRYEYVECSAAGLMFGESNHRELIDQYAELGWRFVGAIPTSFSGHGNPKTFDLIFEIVV